MEIEIIGLVVSALLVTALTATLFATKPRADHKPLAVTRWRGEDEARYDLVQKRDAMPDAEMIDWSGMDWSYFEKRAGDE